MSKRYTSEHKTAVLALLDANGDNIALTAAQCGISGRTIYTWRKERAQRQQYAHQLPQLPELQQHAHQLRQSPELQQHESELPEGDEIVLLRNYVQQTALRIAAKLSRDLESPALYHKVSALNGLLDRLTKIENAFPKTKTPMVVRIERIPLPERISSTPPEGGNDNE